MSFWSNLFSGFGAVAKEVFLVGTLNGLVTEVKTSIDKTDKMSQAEKDAAKVGVDLLAARVTAALNKGKVA